MLVSGCTEDVSVGMGCEDVLSLDVAGVPATAATAAAALPLPLLAPPEPGVLSTLTPPASSALLLSRRVILVPMGVFVAVLATDSVEVTPSKWARRECVRERWGCKANSAGRGASLPPLFFFVAFSN